MDEEMKTPLKDRWMVGETIQEVLQGLLHPLKSRNEWMDGQTKEIWWLPHPPVHGDMDGETIKGGGLG